MGFFGINCGPGVPVPRNGERLLPRGCRGYVTATPKRPNGDDVPAHEHGPNIEWFMLVGADLVDVQAPRRLVLEVQRGDQRLAVAVQTGPEVVAGLDELVRRSCRRARG